MKRIKAKFDQLKAENKSAFIAYICGGDPDLETSFEILKKMPESGVDLIELGVPFLDPSGDGPIIQSASKRAIENGASLMKILDLVKEFRKTNSTTPIILMSYYNPILKFGPDKIFAAAQDAGVDGFLIVDLPLEEEDEITPFITKTNLDLIKLIAPNSDENRIKKLTKNASGFLYLISMLGITGTKDADLKENIKNLQKIKNISSLPVAIGFGIKTPDDAQKFAQNGFDGVVIGSKIVDEIDQLVKKGNLVEKIVSDTAKCLNDFASKIKY